MTTDVTLRVVFFFSRAGKPPVGLHLDVLKNDKLIQVSRHDTFESDYSSEFCQTFQTVYLTLCQ